MPALTLAVVTGILIVAAVDLPAYRRLMQEDGWGEWATFGAFVAAAGLGLRNLPRAPSRADAAMRAALIGFSLFVAGEEVSWGQRLLGFAPPDVFLEHNYQQESNLHNLLKRVLDTRWMVLMIAAGYGVLLPLLHRASQRLQAPRLRRVLAVLSPPAVLLPGFAAVALLEASYPVTLSGEIAELALGLCFVADLALRRREGSEPSARGALLACVAVLGIASLVPMGVDAWTGVHATEETSRARAELNALAADLRLPGVVQTDLRGKRRVHKRIFTAVRAGYLRLGRRSGYLEGAPTPAEEPNAGDARRDPRGYFMDPWMQPYWVRYERLRGNRGRLLLYSFGANRRRDTPVHDLSKVAEESSLLRGDDVGVILEVQWH